MRYLRSLLWLNLVLVPPLGAEPPALSARSLSIAAYAKATYGEASIATLGELVAFRTVETEGPGNGNSPAAQAAAPAPGVTDEEPVLG